MFKRFSRTFQPAARHNQRSRREECRRVDAELDAHLIARRRT